MGQRQSMASDGVRKRKSSPKSSPKIKSSDGGEPVPKLEAKASETKGASKWKKMATRTAVAFVGMGIMTAIVLSDHVVIVGTVALFRTLNWFGYGTAMFYIYGQNLGAYFNRVLLQE